MSSLCKHARNHPRISVLLIVQAAVLFVFAISCLGSAFSVHLTADDLLEGEGLVEYSPDGKGIGVYGEYNAGAPYEILYTDDYTLRPGAYDITVEYAVARDDTLSNYHAYDQASHEEFALQTSENQTIVVEIPAGYEGTVVLKYVPPVSWRIAEIVSLLSVVACLTLYFKSKRKKETP